MNISQKRVNSLEKWTGALVPNTSIRIVHEVTGATDPKLSRTGFSNNPTSNDTILPSVIGPISRFNANGKFIVHKDRPKESRYITTFEWTYFERHGDDLVEQTKFVDVHRQCYPRTPVPPPSSELTYIFDGSKHYIISREFSIGVDDEESIRHDVNLFLELYGACEIRHANLGSITPPATRKVNWVFLPPGQHTQTSINAHLNRLLQNKAARTISPVIYRQKTIASYNPDEVWIGQGGFCAYVAYVFNRKGITVLESLQLDNATYVFGQNWKTVSQLSKAEVLNNNYHINRIFHSAGWVGSINTLLS